jgi:hypothetical protein
MYIMLFHYGSYYHLFKFYVFLKFQFTLCILFFLLKHKILLGTYCDIFASYIRLPLQQLHTY